MILRCSQIFLAASLSTRLRSSVEHKNYQTGIILDDTAHFCMKFITDRINAAGNAIANVRSSVCPPVRPSVRFLLFPLYLRNRLTFDLELLHVSRS